MSAALRRPAELWTIPLRLLTPAFIGGAAPNTRADLRPAGIRGALRAWYRLLVGPEVAAGLVAAHAHLRESRLFGGVGHGEGQSVAALSLVEPPPTGDMAWSNRDLRGPSPGLAYFGFPLDMGENDRRALKPGTTFALRLSFPRGVGEDDAALLLHTLALWVSLGGLGTRSRRGFGGLWLNGTPTFTDFAGRPLPGRALPLPSAGASGALQAALRELLKGAQALRERLGLGLPVESAAHLRAAGPAYHLRLSAKADLRHSKVRLWLGDGGRGWATAQAALDDLGRRMQMKRREPGVDAVGGSPLRLLTERRRLPHAPRRVAFGLPLTLRPLRQVPGDKLGTFNLLPALEDPGGAVGKFSVESRAPSPLLVSVVPVGARFGLALTLLSGPWPGRDLWVTALEGGARATDRQSNGESAGEGPMPLDAANNLPADFIGALPRAEDLWP
ncbi:MAG: hypothetical protein JNM72_14325 [Deltaproteobacteria bacterium]|nr:hypothetical protein [Deltaproteobacteria bacterium]